MNAPTKLLRGGLFLLLVLTTCRNAVAGYITSGPLDWGGAVAVNSIWKREATNEYLPANGITIGQEHSGHDPFNLYRAYMVFDLPKFTGIFTAGSLGLSSDELGGHELVTTKATSATLHLYSLALNAFPYSDLTVEFRQAPLDAGDLLAGKIDLATVFQKLDQGPVWAQPVVPFMQAEDFTFPYYNLFLNDAFTDYLNGRESGRFVVSFTLPFIPETRDFGDTYHLITMESRAYLETQMDYFAADLLPVPEPATYGLCATLGLLSLAIWRRRHALDC